MSVFLSSPGATTGRFLSAPHRKMEVAGSPATCQRPGQWPNSSGGNSTCLSLRAAPKGATAHLGHAGSARSTTHAGVSMAILTSSPGAPQDYLCHAKLRGAKHSQRPAVCASAIMAVGGHTETPWGNLSYVNPRIPQSSELRVALCRHARGRRRLGAYVTHTMNDFGLQDPLIPNVRLHYARTVGSLSVPSLNVLASLKVRDYAGRTIVGSYVTGILLAARHSDVEDVSASLMGVSAPIKRMGYASATTTEPALALTPSTLKTASHPPSGSSGAVSDSSISARCAIRNSGRRPNSRLGSVRPSAVQRDCEGQEPISGGVASRTRTTAFAPLLNTGHGAEQFWPAMITPVSSAASAAGVCKWTTSSPLLRIQNSVWIPTTGGLCVCHVTSLPRRTGSRGGRLPANSREFWL
jgi:hypothetical protein